MEISSQKYDKLLLIETILLVAVGVIMVFSSSTNISMDRFGTGTFYFKRHLIRTVVAISIMFAAAFMDYRILKKYASHLMIFSIVLLIITKILQIAEGSHFPARWLDLGFFSIQTSDIARFATITYLAAYMDRNREKLGDFVSGLLPPLLITGLVMSLIIKQPDYSTAFVIGLIAFILMFLGGAKLSHLFAAGSVSLAILVPVLLAAPYRLGRIKAYLNVGQNFQELNYQVQQSLISLGNGGLMGVGLGESMGKNLFLPAPHTDFILSIVGEEFGFFGCFLVLTLFLAIFQRSVKISKQSTDIFGILLSVGIGIKIITYAFINSAVVAGIVPTTGLPMPFVSFGGTNLLMTLFTIGILLNISMAKRKINNRKGTGVLFAN